MVGLPSTEHNVGCPARGGRELRRSAIAVPRGGPARPEQFFLDSNDVPIEDWDEYLKNQRVNYCGEVAPKAQPLTWEQMEQGLPPPEHCGAIRAEDLAEGTMRDSIMNPQLSLNNFNPAGPRPRQSRLHLGPGERVKIGKALLERQLVDPLEDEELLWFADGPLVDGGFGVGKGKYLPNGLEMQR